MFADPSGQSSGSRSAGLTLNLSSNNPFRNRAASPNSIGSNQFSPPPPHSPFDDPPPRPTSRNPFLDPNNNTNSGNSNSFPAQQPRVKSPGSMSSSNDKSATAFAEDLFNSLSLEDKAAQKTPSLQPSNRPPPPPSRPSRGENGPPPQGRGPPPRGAPHRPTRSQEEAQRAARTHGVSGSLGGEKMFNSSDKRPERRPERRPRRNSDTSVIEKPMTEEEKKAREIRRRERERRHREGKDKDKPKGKRLDLIDQLDATSIYGTGLFHHDGPFDALNPHRNRGGTRRAPMEAFPEGSLNNSLGGSGPINTRPDHATFMGNHDDEGFREWSGAGKDRNGYVAPDAKTEGGFFDPTARGTMLHGDESMGLGTSTFLEGAPAARADIQRRQAELAAQEQGGLQRKKSLAQRFRGMNRERPSRDYAGARMTNPEGAYGPRSGDLPTSSSTGERNPFFSDFDNKGGEERISVKRSDAMSPGSAGGNSPPRGYMERRPSEQLGQASPTDPSGKPQGGGFLSRVKSLKGGRRQRPEVPSHPPPTNNAGTAV